MSILSSPLRPLLLKGALAVYPEQTPGAQPAKVIVFQFNPDTMKRTLANRAPQQPTQGQSGAAREDVLRVAGPPVETINMTIELDAADQLEDPDSNTTVAENGLGPALATLELLMYPTTQLAQTIVQQAQQGSAQVSPPDVPLVLLVWGRSRVVPVKLTSFLISEEAFDTQLNPLVAKVELGLQVLTYMEFTDSSVGRDAFVAYQQAKESLAAKDTPSPAAIGIRTLLPS